MAKIEVYNSKTHKYNIKLTDVEFNILHKLLDKMSWEDFENFVGEDYAVYLDAIWCKIDIL